MKVKRILRFYFFAESLDKAFDNLIIKNACDSADSFGGGAYADRLCELIWERRELARFWEYLDGVICKLAEDERASLKFYAGMRFGIKRLDDGKRKEIKRAAVKFARRARRLESFSEASGLADKYYCLLTPA